MGDIVLQVGGQRFSGWQSVTIRRGMDQLAATFDLKLTEAGAPDGVPVSVSEGSACQVLVGARKLIDGYIDDVEQSYDSYEHAVAVQGRSKTGDLVDCSAVHAGEWKKQTLLQIAQELCRPFAIKVRAEASVGEPFGSYAVQPGETVHECLERAARMRGVLLMTDAAGDLVITRASRRAVATTIKLGENVLRGARKGSWMERHSRYVVLGQASGDDDNFGEVVATKQAAVNDQRIARHRPLVLHAEEQEADLAGRAAWERSVRYGRSLQATYVVQGWEHGSGVWEPNTLVRVEDPFLRIAGEMLVVSVTLSLSEQGTFTELVLSRPEAYSLRALPSPAAESAQWDLDRRNPATSSVRVRPLPL